MITFPQGDGRARVYLCPGMEDPQRFAGRDGTERFLLASAVRSIPNRDAWAEATPAGPARTYPGDDTWTDQPFTDGVVLIGDAAGHNNPLIGQGLSLALCDVRCLSDRLVNDNWDAEQFASYGTERAARLLKMQFVAQLEAVRYTTFGAEGQRLREDLARRQRGDPSLWAPGIAQIAGPDHLPAEAHTEEFRRRYLGGLA
jgi:menaquinone-9 beta-reductase